MREPFKNLLGKSSQRALHGLGWRVLEVTDATLRDGADRKPVDDSYSDELLALAVNLGRANIGDAWQTIDDAPAGSFEVGLFGEMERADGKHIRYALDAKVAPRPAPLTEGLADWLDGAERTIWRDEPSGYPRAHGRWSPEPHADRQRYLDALTTPDVVDRLAALYTPVDWRYWVEFVYRLKEFRRAMDSITPGVEYAEREGLRPTVKRMLDASEIGPMETVLIGDAADEAAALRTVFEG